MLDKIKKNIHYILILLVSITLIICGTIYYINNIKYKENAIIVDASIYQISNNNNIKTLYLKYYINGRRYEGVITSNDKNITINSKIKIYCNKKKPSEFIDSSTPKYCFYLIIIGVFIFIIDFFLFIKNKLK